MHSAEFIVSEEEMRHEEDEMRRWPCPQYDRDINDVRRVLGFSSFLQFAFQIPVRPFGSDIKDTL